MNERYNFGKTFAFVGLFCILSNKLIGGRFSAILTIIFAGLSGYFTYIKKENTDYVNSK